MLDMTYNSGVVWGAWGLAVLMFCAQVEGGEL